MTFNSTSTIFGKEKSKGVLEGIIGSVYQSAFGEDIYPSIQEKAANLLYFIIKDHPFIDGCKRIAASIFLYFLNKNNFWQYIGGNYLTAGRIKTRRKRNHD